MERSPSLDAALQRSKDLRSRVAEVYEALASTEERVALTFDGLARHSDADRHRLLAREAAQQARRLLSAAEHLRR